MIYNSIEYRYYEALKDDTPQKPMLSRGAKSTLAALLVDAAMMRLDWRFPLLRYRK
jgi:hypothetical protein